MNPVAALLEILRDEGVDRIFGNPGTTELPFIDALAKAPDLEYVLAVQEASAVAMADGYARATGRTAFVSLHVAAGLANGLIGLLNAKRSRTPLVVTAGQQDRRHLLTDPMLSGDLVGLAQAASKQAVEVQHARDLPVVLRRAFALAATPPEGPVFVSIPMDLLDEEVDVEVPARSAIAPLGAAARLEEAARLLAGAENLAVVAGDGVSRDGAVAELVNLAERLDTPVHHQPMHDRLNFPFTHPLHRGMIPPRNAAVREALTGHDVVFVVGTHAFFPHHYTPGPAIPPGTRVVQLDDDPAVLGKNFPVELGLAGGIRATLTALLELTDMVGRVNQPVSRLDQPASPASGADQPVSRVNQPASPASRAGQPVSRINQPTSAINQPVIGTDQPASGANQLVSGSDESASRINQPVSGINQPVSQVDQQVSRADQPVSRVEQPVSRVNQPVMRPEPAAPVPVPEQPGESVAAPLDPQVAARAIAAGLPQDAVVVDEAITVGVLLRPLLGLDRPGSFVHTVGGGLGWGIGAAVGTRLAQDRPVVAVLGDGSTMFGLQGLWTAARYQVPVLFLVMNNGEYRTLRNTLAESYGPGPHPGLDLGRMDWRKAAEFFGVAARRVNSDAELRVLVASAGSLRAPLLVDVPLR
jgi:benzoylformate decarboxylase